MVEEKDRSTLRKSPTSTLDHHQQKTQTWHQSLKKKTTHKEEKPKVSFKIFFHS